MWAGEQINEKHQNGCHLKTIHQNNQKSNQHIVRINVNQKSNQHIVEINGNGHT